MLNRGRTNVTAKIQDVLVSQKCTGVRPEPGEHCAHDQQENLTSFDQLGASIISLQNDTHKIKYSTSTFPNQ